MTHDFGQTMSGKDRIPHQDAIIKAILAAAPDLKEIFLFGSRARGDHSNPHADIDLGMINDCKLQLAQLGRIEEKIEQLDMLYKVEAVDFSHRQDEFTEEALRDKVTLYEKR